MKTIITTLGLSLVAALGLMGQAKTAAPTLKCVRQDGGACTAHHLEGLLTSIKAAGQGARPGLAGVNNLSLAPNGTVKCEQKNGQQCTAEQVRLMREVSAASPYSISVVGGK